MKIVLAAAALLLSAAAAHADGITTVEANTPEPGCGAASCSYILVNGSPNQVLPAGLIANEPADQPSVVVLSAINSGDTSSEATHDSWEAAMAAMTQE